MKYLPCENGMILTVFFAACRQVAFELSLDVFKGCPRFSYHSCSMTLHEVSDFLADDSNTNKLPPVR